MFGINYYVYIHNYIGKYSCIYIYILVWRMNSILSIFNETRFYWPILLFFPLHFVAYIPCWSGTNNTRATNRSPFCMSFSSILNEGFCRVHVSYFIFCRSFFCLGSSHVSFSHRNHCIFSSHRICIFHTKFVFKPENSRRYEQKW